MQNSKDSAIRAAVREGARELWRCKWLILLAAVLCGAMALFYCKVIVTPLYRSEAVLQVDLRGGSGLSELSVSQLKAESKQIKQLLRDCTENITEHAILDRVIEELRLNATYEVLKASVKAEADTGSRTVRIAVTDTEPDVARMIADYLCDTAAKQLPGLTEADKVTVKEYGTLPQKPYTPRTAAAVLVSTVVGLVLCCAALLTAFFWDGKLRTAEDVQKYLGLAVLGTVPAEQKTERTVGGPGTSDALKDLVK